MVPPAFGAARLERRHLAVAGAGLVGLGVVGLFDPTNWPVGLPCPLRVMTGLDCPLCGATRATHALLRGDLFTALDFNALYVVALPLLAVAFVVWLRSGQWPSVLRGRQASWGLAVVAVAFAVLRNLPALSSG